MHQAKYGRTHKGLAARYRTSGFDPEAADVLARAVVSPYGQCEICGLPHRVLTHYRKRRIPTPMPMEVWTLSVDHVKPRSRGGPNTLTNARVLCVLCNTRRADARYTDEVVLRWVRRQWFMLHTNRDMWWLNTEPGRGGKAYRGQKHPEWVLDLPEENSAFRRALVGGKGGAWRDANPVCILLEDGAR